VNVTAQALEGVLDEEAMQEQDEAIQSAIQEEEEYLQKIKEAEGEQIPHLDNEEEDEELGVSASAINPHSHSWKYRTDSQFNYHTLIH